MPPANLLLEGRYQYNPNEPLRVQSTHSTFRAYDKVTKKDLVLLIRPENDPLLDRLKQIKSPFVTLVFDIVNVPSNQIGILLEGGYVTSLQQAINRNGHLTETDAFVILKYVLLGLLPLHERGVPFGRLCPANVSLCNYALIKLGYEVLPERVPQAYIAPQVLRGEEPTLLSDMYSLGVLLYHLLYGIVPFAGQDKECLIDSIQDRKFRVPETVSFLKLLVGPEVRKLAQQLLSYEPYKRPNIATLLDHQLLSFPVETELLTYVKPKAGILPESLHKRFLVYRPSKTLTYYGGYYNEASYLALNVKDGEFVTLYVPEIKMFETEPRRVDSYFQKLKAIQLNYSEEKSEFLLNVLDFDRFRQEPVIICQYCNQGNLHSYLDQMKALDQVLPERQISILMYILAVALKQIRDLGVTSIHTINPQRIMLKNGSLKVREPGLITPSVLKRLQESTTIDYFAPELKVLSNQGVQFDRSDIWSYGMIYYYLSACRLPVPTEDGHIDLEQISIDRRNRTLIGRCLDYSVEKRADLTCIKIQRVDEDLLEKMLAEKRQKDPQQQEVEAESDNSEQPEGNEDRKVMFKRHKVKLFKHYNKIICQSSTHSCRLWCKSIVTLALLWGLFFGTFMVNGGIGMLRVNYYRPITLEVPANYGTTTKNMTILTTDGLTIATKYTDMSYEQFIYDLRCFQNSYGATANRPINDFINSSHSIYCALGFLFAILVSILYVLSIHRLDLPSLLELRKRALQQVKYGQVKAEAQASIVVVAPLPVANFLAAPERVNKSLYHFLMITGCILPTTLYCFFYIFSLEYMLQFNPCLGFENRGYPKFTSADALLKGDWKTFCINVLLTVGVWSIGLLVYGFGLFFSKRLNLSLYEWRSLIPFWSLWVLLSIICRIGFGVSVPISPSWSYGMSRDLFLQTSFGFLGFFPQVLCWGIIGLWSFIDFLFWVFLRLGLAPDEDLEISRVEIVQVKFQSTEMGQKDPNTLINQRSNANIYAIEDEFL